MRRPARARRRPSKYWGSATGSHPVHPAPSGAARPSCLGSSQRRARSRCWARAGASWPAASWNGAAGCRRSCRVSPDSASKGLSSPTDPAASPRWPSGARAPAQRRAPASASASAMMTQTSPAARSGPPQAGSGLPRRLLSLQGPQRARPPRRAVCLSPSRDQAEVRPHPPAPVPTGSACLAQASQTRARALRSLPAWATA